MKKLLLLFFIPLWLPMLADDQGTYYYYGEELFPFNGDYYYFAGNEYDAQVKLYVKYPDLITHKVFEFSQIENTLFNYVLKEAVIEKGKVFAFRPEHMLTKNYLGEPIGLDGNVIYSTYGSYKYFTTSDLNKNSLWKWCYWIYPEDEFNYKANNSIICNCKANDIVEKNATNTGDDFSGDIYLDIKTGATAFISNPDVTGKVYFRNSNGWSKVYALLTKDDVTFTFPMAVESLDGDLYSVKLPLEFEFDQVRFIDKYSQIPNADTYANCTPSRTMFFNTEYAADGSAPTVTLTEGVAYTNQTEQKADVSFTRTIPATSGWQTWYMPFDVTVAELIAGEYIEKTSDILEFEGVADDDSDKVATFRTLADDAILTANTPYLYKPKTSGKVTYDFEGKTIKAADETQVGDGDWKFVGNYANKTDLNALGAYAISGGEFHKVGEGAVLKPYRAYLLPPTGGQSAPARLRIKQVDSEATGIIDIGSEDAQDNVYYDLTGRKVLNPTKGVYILNKKKVIVK